MVPLSNVVQAAIVTSRPKRSILLGNHMQGGGPGAGCFLAHTLLLQIPENSFGCIQLGWGESAEFGEDRRALRLDVVLYTMGLLVETGQGLTEHVSELGAKSIEGV